MENASKALIIAGAILLAILLISLGIMIFGQAQDTVNNSGMTQAQITAFNNKFIKYEGERTGSVVKTLINEILSSNADPSLPDVTFEVNNRPETNTTKIDTSKKYTITIDYNTSTGYVSNINIDE